MIHICWEQTTASASLLLMLLAVMRTPVAITVPLCTSCPRSLLISSPTASSPSLCFQPLPTIWWVTYLLSSIYSTLILISSDFCLCPLSFQGWSLLLKPSSVLLWPCLWSVWQELDWPSLFQQACLHLQWLTSSLLYPSSLWWWDAKCTTYACENKGLAWVLWGCFTEVLR